MATAKKTDRFTLLSAEAPRRLIVKSWGREKSGKTHFGLTMPGPIYGLYFDPGGIEGVAQKFLAPPLGPKVIRSVQYRFNKKRNTQEDAIALKEQFLDDYEAALNSDARSLQIDETELYELFRFAEWGRESARGREYGPLNGEYRGLLQDAYDAGKNLQLIQKVKESWVDDKPTGEMIPSGFKLAGNIVQTDLAHAWELVDGKPVFRTQVTFCRQNMQLAGQEFTDLDFQTLGQLVYPDSDESEWVS